MHKPQRNIKPFEREVTIHYISELMVIPRENNVDLKKVELTVETDDGQVFFPELRYNKIHFIKKLDLKPKDRVKLVFTFQGSEKGDKKYNNIYIVGIIKE